MKRRKISRRALMRATGLGAGAALLAPMAHRFARAAGETPCRFVFVVEGNGFEPVTMLADSARAQLDATMSAPVGSRRWWYRDYGHESVLDIDSADLDGARSLSALGTHGLVDRATAVLGLSSRVVGGGHSSSHGVLSSARTVGASPGGPTIDAYLAANAAIVGETPFDAIRLGVGTGSPLNFRTVAYDRARPAPMILNPSTAYGVMFGAVAADTSDFDARGDLLSFARADVEAMRSEFRSGTERDKLDAYVDAIERLSERQRRLETATGLADVAPTAPADNPLHASEDALDTLAAQFELATAALLGDLTNVVVLGSGTGGDFNLTYNSVSASKRHDIMHGAGGSNTFLEAAHTVTERQVDLVAQMARTFADTPDVGGGSMLDNTLIVYISGNGEQHHSTSSDFPMLLLGGQGLGLAAGGRTLVYPGLEAANHRQVSNIWNTVGTLAAMDTAYFGNEGPTRMAPGPLSELLA